MMSAFTHSSPERPVSLRNAGLLALAVLASLVIYLSFSAFSYRIGFPLDDSWIHQTYARNLALRGEWSFLPGKVSAGSTSPLWTVLQAVGYLFHLSPYIWTYFLGALTFLGVCILVEVILRQTLQVYRPGLPWAGWVLAFEWHLAWAAFSGMETILQIFLVLCVMRLLLTHSRNYTAAGLLTGLSIWVRPDGLTLLGPLILAILAGETTWRRRARGWLGLICGLGVLFIPYIIFNLAVSGAPMPNTFYAKQAEYANWQASPLQNRLFFWSLQFFLGLSLPLIPGFILKIIRAMRGRDWGLLLAAVWLCGYNLVYLVRLPVYQHGRYYLPALAVFLLIGLSGLLESLQPFPRLRTSIMGAAWLGFFVLILPLSFFYGGWVFGQDTALIESQMVDTARWVAKNLPPDAVIAAHDIGALGFFDRHPLVDLAGLISPAVVPIINDDRALVAYMREQHVQYLVAFQGWKPALHAAGVEVFSSSANLIDSNDLGVMAVYRLGDPYSSGP